MPAFVVEGPTSTSRVCSVWEGVWGCSRKCGNTRVGALLGPEDNPPPAVWVFGPVGGGLVFSLVAVIAGHACGCGAGWSVWSLRIVQWTRASCSLLLFFQQQ